MRIQEVLKLVRGKCEIIYEGKSYSNAEEIQSKTVIEGISAVDGVIRIHAAKDSVIPNDMNEPWVKEYVEKYGREPNPFDGF